jgi:hypothetical protein
MDKSDRNRPGNNVEGVQLLTTSVGSPIGTTDCDPIAPHYPTRRLQRPHRMVEGEAVVLDVERGRIYQLNATATFVWTCCDGTSNPQEIALKLAQVFDVDVTTATEDTNNIIVELEEVELLERNQKSKLSEGDNG